MERMIRPIGVFDSGVGGLTVMRELIKELPYEDIIYFGDTARVPYGIKSPETVIKFSTENILFLLRHQVKLVCIACNTSSSIALPKLMHYFKIPLVGVISAGCREAVYASRNKRIGVIGTKATIASNAYQAQLKQLDPQIKVFAASCPLFVPLAEEGWLQGDVARQVATRYLMPLKRARIDTLILGCTHYPLLKGVIRQVLGKEVKLIDSAKQVAIEVKKILQQEGTMNMVRRKPIHSFYVSDDPAWFTSLAQRFLGESIKTAHKVNYHV